MTASNSPFFGPIPEGVCLGQAEDSGFMSMLQEQIFPDFAPGYRSAKPDDKGLARAGETTDADELASVPGRQFSRVLQQDEGSSTQRRMVACTCYLNIYPLMHIKYRKSVDLRINTPKISKSKALGKRPKRRRNAGSLIDCAGYRISIGKCPVAPGATVLRDLEKDTVAGANNSRFHT
jgi:hypothetical protein